MIKNFFSIVLFFCIFPYFSFAEKKDDNFLDWKVFSNIVDSKKYCYMVSVPISKSASLNYDSVAYFLISNNNNIDEISISCGYDFKKNYDLTLFVGLKKFFLMTYENLAWTKDNYSDIEIIKEMMKAEKITAYCVSSKNKDSFQTYSLIGFLEAYYKMKDECRG
jgi:hypothetical protein